MYGNLFVYDPKHHLVAFESGPVSSSRCLILIGGLTEGLLSLPYVEKLSSKLESLPNPYSLIQPLLRSSNLQFGWHSIDTDIEDFKALLDYLTKNRTNLESIILMGHSTGCNDIIHYLRNEKPHPKIVRAILQAPVSDRQHLCRNPVIKDQLDYCRKNIETKNEWLPRTLYDLPVTIERWLSLVEIDSKEDLFSSDLTGEQLKDIYENIQIPVLWIWSGKDQYVPVDLKEEVENFVRKKLANKPGSAFILLKNADHEVHDEEEQVYMVEQITQTISPST